MMRLAPSRVIDAQLRAIAGRRLSTARRQPRCESVLRTSSRSSGLRKRLCACTARASSAASTAPDTTTTGIQASDRSRSCASRNFTPSIRGSMRSRRMTHVSACDRKYRRASRPSDAVATSYPLPESATRSNSRASASSSITRTVQRWAATPAGTRPFSARRVPVSDERALALRRQARADRSVLPCAFRILRRGHGGGLRFAPIR
jgi:hypothetical protein